MRTRKRRAVLCNLQELQFPSPTVYVPYVCGALRAYAEQFEDICDTWTFAEPVWRLQSLEAMLAEIGEADLIGFSCYVWNTRNSLRLAREVKARRPEAFVVCGGPHVPNRPSDFLTQHPFVDACVHGEGEAAFTALLRARAGGTPLDDVPSLSFLRDGVQVFTPRAARLAALDYPSPFLRGMFDEMVAHARALDTCTIVMASLETNRGCPYSCAFCDWGMATMTKLRQRDGDVVRRELDWIAGQKLDAVVLSDANFGILPRDVELMAHAAALKREHGAPRSFFPTGFAKNNKDRAFAINRIIIDNDMDPYGVNVNFSLQSMSQDTLDSIDRQNIPLESYRRTADLYGSSGYTLKPDLILPLPGETLESFTAGYADLCTWRQVARVRVYPCMVLPNAPMAHPDYREKWGLHTIVTEMGKRDAVRRSDADALPEHIEAVIATAHMSEEQHVQAKAWVHWVNALEMTGLTRPLRMHAGRVRDLSPRDFYARLLEWQLTEAGVLADAMPSVLDAVSAHGYSDEVAWTGEATTHDGLRMKPHKALAYDALTRADRFADELARFSANVLDLDDDLTHAVLSFQRDRWVTPATDPEDEATYQARYALDWFAWLAGEAAAPPARSIAVTYARPPLWSGYRRSLTSWRAYALADSQIDTWCVLGLAGANVTGVDA